MKPARHAMCWHFSLRFHITYDIKMQKLRCKTLLQASVALFWEQIRHQISIESADSPRDSCEDGYQYCSNNNPVCRIPARPESVHHDKPIPFESHPTATLHGNARFSRGQRSALSFDGSDGYRIRIALTGKHRQLEIERQRRSMLGGMPGDVSEGMRRSRS